MCEADELFDKQPREVKPHIIIGVLLRLSITFHLLELLLLVTEVMHKQSHSRG